MNLENWKPFQIGRLFTLKNGKGITQEEIAENPGVFAAVQSGEENNGVMGYIDLQYCKQMGYALSEKPCLTVARSGSAGFVSFQVHGCVVGDSAKILLLDEDVASIEVYVFLQSVLTTNRIKYTYGRKVTEGKYLTDWVKLPAQCNTNGIFTLDDSCRWSDEGYVPDWQFMEDYIKSLHYKPLTTKNKSGTAPKLKVTEWKEFRVGDLFDIHPTKALDGVNSEECNGRGVPLVVNQSNNNGVVGMCDYPPSESGGIITFSDTWEGETFFYQPEAFIGFAHVQGMYPKCDEISGECLLFIATVLEFEARGRYSYGRKKRRDIIRNVTIKLPADADGNPDWQFMEDYIKSLPYGDRLEETAP